MAEERKKYYKTFKIKAVEMSWVEFCSKQGKRSCWGTWYFTTI